MLPFVGAKGKELERKVVKPHASFVLESSVAIDSVGWEFSFDVVVLSIRTWVIATWMHSVEVLVDGGESSFAVMIEQDIDLTVGIHFRSSSTNSWIFGHVLAIVSCGLLKTDPASSKDIVNITEVRIVIKGSLILGLREASDNTLLVTCSSQLSEGESEVINIVVPTL